MIRALKRPRVRLILTAAACFLVAGAYGARDLSGFLGFMFASTGGSIMALTLTARAPSHAAERRAVRFTVKRYVRRGQLEFRVEQALLESFRLGARYQRQLNRSPLHD